MYMVYEVVVNGLTRAWFNDHDVAVKVARLMGGEVKP